MQKPAAYGASVLVLLVLIHSITVVEAADQHEQVCISPGANGEYNVSYNKAKLLVAKPSEVQDLVLETVGHNLLTNGFSKGPDELCSWGHDYSVVAHGLSSIYLFSYAYCGQDIDRPRCADCLYGGVQAIKQFCADGCYGAQASSVDCCIRFEPEEFCKVTIH